MRITQILDATCNVNAAKCYNLMQDLAYKIRLDTVCGKDYQQENPYVRQAYNGFISYKMEYEAACMKDSKGSYCKSFSLFFHTCSIYCQNEKKASKLTMAE